MKLASSYKNALLLLSFPVAFFMFSFMDDPSLLETILLKMRDYHNERPQEKIYLHLDKPFYAAGENVWFKAYLVEATLHSLDSQSRVIYVELINQKKTIISRKVLFAEGGVSWGDLQLPDTLSQGKYLIRA